MTFHNINLKAWLTKAFYPKERKENEAMLLQLSVILLFPGGVTVKQKLEMLLS